MLVLAGAVSFLVGTQLDKRRSRGLRDTVAVSSKPGFRDSSGNVWEADRYFPRRGATERFFACEFRSGEELNRSERFGNFVYSIPVPQNSTYTVTLRLQENVPPPLPNTNPTDIFNVYLNGQLLLDHFKRGIGNEQGRRKRRPSAIFAPMRRESSFSHSCPSKTMLSSTRSKWWMRGRAQPAESSIPDDQRGGWSWYCDCTFSNPQLWTKAHARQGVERWPSQCLHLGGFALSEA